MISQECEFHPLNCQEQQEIVGHLVVIQHLHQYQLLILTKALQSQYVRHCISLIEITAV